MGSSKTTHTIVIMWSLIVINLALVAALPTEVPSDGVIDERIVNREDARADTAITGSLVNDVKQINVLLNIPNNCNAENIYNDMIKQINNCKTGSDRGHPNLNSGCLLKIDFTMPKSECQNSKLSFPTDTENIWHPRPTCNGEYCQESSNLEFSKTENSNVAFPKEQTPKDESYSGPY